MRPDAPASVRGNGSGGRIRTYDQAVNSSLLSSPITARKPLSAPDESVTESVTGLIIQRFWAKVERRGEDECWPWTGARFPFGYGAIKVAGRPFGAHRISWIIANGAVPRGQYVLHRCDNPPCVNPAHLFLGTLRDNALDMIGKGRHASQKRAVA